MALKIKGVIGWDVTGAEFSEKVSRCDGDINLEIDSPGGSVSHGLAIANALEDYSKGKINIRVTGQASSMAAYIMLFGDSLKFKPNAVVVLHNPWNTCTGDYKKMQKAANILERFSALYAKKFIEKKIFSEKEIHDIMDAETYFIGEDDLKRLGDIDKTDTKADAGELERETQIAIAQENIKQCQARLRQAEFNDLERVAALIPENKQMIQAGFGGKISPPAPSGLSDKTGATFVRQDVESTVQKEKGEKIMDLQELETKNPDVYAQVVKVGEEKNQKRINALMEFIDVDKETVIKAIAEGKSIQDDEIQAKLLKARINASTLAQMESDNPEQTNPKEPEHKPESELGEPKTEEQKQKEQEEKEEQDFKEACGYLGLEVK